MSKEKPGIVLYWEMLDTFDILSGEEAKDMICACRDYGRYGVVPDFGDNGCLNVLWCLMRYHLDTDNEKYEKVRQARSEAGKKSAEKRAQQAEEAEQVS